MGIKKFRRNVSVFGIAIASMFGAPLPMVRKSHEDDGDPGPGLRTVNEEGIITSEDVVQGQWFGWSDMDEHLYRRESMENLVAHENAVDGRHWKTATFFIKGENQHGIRGTRNDGAEFSVEASFNLRDRHLFDQLCQDFNKNLKSEVTA